MTHSFTATIRDRTAETETTARVEIPDDDWAKLLAYADAVEELKQSDAVRDDFRVRVTFKGSKTTGVHTETSVPSDDHIAVLLHRVRPFVLQNEPMYFHKTLNLLAKHMVHPELREVLDRQRRLFSGTEFQDQVRIDLHTPEVNGITNSERTFNLWINSFEYHRDSAKKSELEQLCGLLPFNAVRGILLSMLVDKVNAILHLAALIRQCQVGDGQSRPT